MKAYIIYLPKSDKSVAAFKESSTSALNMIEGIDIVPWEGVDKYSVWDLYIKSGLRPKDIMKFGGGHLDSEFGTFFSHYSLWEECTKLEENILILEHDAEFLSNVDLKLLKEFDGDILNLGYPSWSSTERVQGKQWAKHWEGKGIVKREVCTAASTHRDRCDCDSQYLYGAHAYVVTPIGASKLIKAAKNGFLPADVFIDQKIVNIHDLLPHACKQKNSFSFIQRYRVANNQELNAWDY